MQLVKTRTEVKNRIHSLPSKHGLCLPHKTPFSKKNVAWLREQDLGFMDDAILRSGLVALEAVDGQIGFMEEKIAVPAAEDPQVRLLMTMPGVGYFSAILLLAEIGDINRFSSDRRFASWAGLAPSVSQSGEKIGIGGVGGPGKRRVRWVMVQHARSACGFNPGFRSFHER